MGKIAALLLIAAVAPAQAAKYDIDAAHSSVAFKIRHFVGQVQGSFNEFSGSFEFDAKAPAKASVDAVIKTASVDTRNEGRDKHLRGEDFFEVEKFPEMTFKGDKLTVGKGKGQYKLSGTLALHGVEKPVTLAVSFGGELKDAKGKMHAGFTASGTINRKDFGIVFNKTLDNGGLMLGEDVAVDIEVEGVQAQ